MEKRSTSRPPRKVTLGDRLRYAFDNTMSRGTPALIGWLAIMTAILIAIFVAIVLIGGLAPKDDNGKRPGLIGQLFKTLLHALDPGTVAGDTGKWPFLLAMLLVTLGGLFIVSSLIGVIATGFDKKIEDLRKGRSFVIEHDHTLILGWSDTVFTILSELRIANENEKDPCVVILADRDRVEMEDAIRAKLPDLGNTRVVCRTGNAIDLNDLEVVNPHGARSIIVLSPEDDDPDSHVIKTILALTKGPNRRDQPYHIVAEIEDPENLEAARLVGGEEAVLIDKRETISRLIVQSSRQSGVSVAYTELLDFDGDEIYFREDPALAGQTFGHALHAYEDCTIIGLRLAHGGVVLNPPPGTPIGPGDRVIAIAEDDEQLAAAVASPNGRVDEEAIAQAKPREAMPQRTLLLGWNNRAPSVINELDNYVSEGSTATVVADVPDAERAIQTHCTSLRNLSLEFRLGETTDRRLLDSLGVDAYDHVIVLCYSELLDAQRADARTLVTLLHLRDIAGRTGAEFSIVSEMLDDRNRELAEVTKVDDVIVSDKVTSLMLSQMAENHELKDVFADLFAAEGSEIYLKPAEDYIRNGAPTTFRTVVEAARRRGEIAIGYRSKADADDSAKAYGVRVNPPKSQPISPADGDRVIVLAES